MKEGGVGRKKNKGERTLQKYCQRRAAIFSLLPSPPTRFSFFVYYFFVRLVRNTPWCRMTWPETARLVALLRTGRWRRRHGRKRTAENRALTCNKCLLCRRWPPVPRRRLTGRANCVSADRLQDQTPLPATIDVTEFATVFFISSSIFVPISFQVVVPRVLAVICFHQLFYLWIERIGVYAPGKLIGYFFIWHTHAFECRQNWSGIVWWTVIQQFIFISKYSVFGSSL